MFIGWGFIACQREGTALRDAVAVDKSSAAPEGIIGRFRGLGDASGILSDVMDELGITGDIGTSVLKPTTAGQSGG